MPTETREQFRERIGRIAAASDGVDFDQLNETLQDAVSDQAEAVYAQAWKDLLEEFGGIETYFTDFWGNREPLSNFIREVADDLGINLEAHDERD